MFKNYALIFFLTFLAGILSGQKNASDNCLEIHRDWLKHSLQITKNAVGFSAPVAARAFAYLNVGIYESSLDRMPQGRSLSGQLQGFERKVFRSKNEKLLPELVCNEVNYQLVKYFYRNMPAEYQSKTEIFYKLFSKKYAKGRSYKTVKKSVLYGQALANEIIQWSKSDGADDGFNKNFPVTYQNPSCDSCWLQTFPGYFKALQPYWGKNRLFIASNQNFKEELAYFAFSTDTASVLYQDALEIYNLKPSKESETIAEYWDDSPGYSGTPPGHLLSLAIQLSEEKKLDLSKSLSLYTMLTIAMNDAFIETWNLKYKYNLLRPVTYIERHIAKGFNPIIPTPPFPEFPSGHSCQSGAGAEVFIHIFGDDLSFTDRTNLDRRDIDGSPRSFKSFSEMSEEISISRFYGGIHFKTTLKNSLIYGRKIGKNVISNLILTP
jgi:hypothetical protein